MPKAKKAPRTEPADPDKLEREAAGSYKSGDGRFEVRQSAANWYLVDKEQTNEFGQELLQGPFGTLNDVRKAIPGARNLKPLLKSRPRPQSQPKMAKPPPPPTWIDRLPASEAAEVRRVIRALEREGIDNADDLVRQDRKGSLPVIATRLIESRLDGLLDGLSKTDREAAEKVLLGAAEVLGQGERLSPSLPGWALVEIGRDRQPTKRPIRLKR